jgi:alpha-L-rhamnosidase
MENNSQPQQTHATWIWFPGDFEIWLGNKMNNRRTDRGAFFPPFWKQDSHYPTVEFSKVVDLSAPERIHLAVEGRYNVKIDGRMLFGQPIDIDLAAGTHHLNIKVWNPATPPAIYVDGPTVKSDSTWKVTQEDKEWIDDSGKASDTSASIYEDAGCWNFDSPQALPSQFRLSRQRRVCSCTELAPGKLLLDFGRETFGYLVLNALGGHGGLNIYYGESREEALDADHCETLDRLAIDGDTVTDLSTGAAKPAGEEYVLENSKAFRYICIDMEPGVTLGDASMDYEYLPEEARGSFECSDPEVNKIWQTSVYTLHLTTREMFIDGIKRDRWTWSGDAYQSYLMNYYLFFDTACVRRTTWQLRGKDPVTAHVNTIMDYTFYWLIGVYDYYLYTGDRHFVEQIYPRMQSLMAYVLSRTDEEGMVEGLAGDWVFVDWSPKPMDKHGQLSFEQVLFCRSLEVMALCARLLGHADEAGDYEQKASDLHGKLLPKFWNEKLGALVHNVVDGRQSTEVTRYANMFAMLYGYLDERKRTQVRQYVMHNPAVMGITTPYMRFYELEALCAMGEQSDVLRQMKDYWGGMLNEGATTFWEKYDPHEHGTEHLAMYGRPYGKSLCHAWGASPLYLLGKYFLGVSPVKAGYSEWRVQPVLGGLQWIRGSVPTPHGSIEVRMDRKAISMKADEGEGYVYFSSLELPHCVQGNPEKLSATEYRLHVVAGQEATIDYTPCED